jgi:HNH endonuclease
MSKRFRSPPSWTAQQRLDHYTIPEALTGCWLCWAAPKLLNYPGLTWKGKVWLAHRLAWQESRGPIPEDMDVCHRCDNPPCVNPDHLFLGTHQDNMRDRNRKGRQAHLRGEQNGSTKITEVTALKIMDLLRTAGPKHVSRRLGISYHIVQDINRGKTWKHLHDKALSTNKVQQSDASRSR